MKNKNVKGAGGAKQRKQAQSRAPQKAKKGRANPQQYAQAKKAARRQNVGQGKNNAAAPLQAQNVQATQRTRSQRRTVLGYGGPKGNLKVIFLGGVGEIGKNMTVFEYGDSMVIVDVGMSFPGSDMPGVDVVIPDFSYVVQNRKKLKAILLTHGHEDHIGAIAYLVKALGGKVDVYGSKLTLALVENKLAEHSVIDKVNLVAVADKSVVMLDDFTAEFIHVSHSVAGSLAICLRTPVGVVLHTGDFKIDYTPLGNEIMNLNRIAEVGKQGVLLLMSESTNVEKTGYTMSESVVEDTMNKVFQDAKGRRIIVATFASNVDRIGMVIDLARRYKRKIALSGRSMLKYVETACRVGQMSVDHDMFVDVDRVNSIEDGRLVILSTGSQGEPMSALTRMASGEFNKVHIGSNDTIVISASPIPARFGARLPRGAQAYLHLGKAPLLHSHSRRISSLKTARNAGGKAGTQPRQRHHSGNRRLRRGFSNHLQGGGQRAKRQRDGGRSGRGRRGQRRHKGQTFPCRGGYSGVQRGAGQAQAAAGFGGGNCKQRLFLCRRRQRRPPCGRTEKGNNGRAAGYSAPCYVRCGDKIRRAACG